MILGVYYSEKDLKKLYKRNLKSKMNFLAEEAFKEEVKVLIFSPSSINWISRKINGLVYNSVLKKWNYEMCPFPDVIYDLATFVQSEKELGKVVRHRLTTEYNLPFINSKSYFNKWGTHKVLSDDSKIITHLPNTVKYYHPFQLVDFLNKYDSVYIKDSGGKRGKNIFKLQKLQNGLYILSYQDSGNMYSEKLTLQEVHSKFVADKLLGKTIIIQQGIDMASLKDRPFDVRILAQKNERENWEVVDKSIRIASPGSIVTNVSSGGEVKKFSEVIPLLFSNSTYISSEIDMLVIKICRVLEKKYGRLGELGIDIAIDIYGYIWLLEVNGKPSKLCIYKSGDLELINKSCRNLVRYSKVLAKFKNEFL